MPSCRPLDWRLGFLEVVDRGRGTRSRARPESKNFRIGAQLSMASVPRDMMMWQATLSCFGMSHIIGQTPLALVYVVDRLCLLADRRVRPVEESSKYGPT